MLIILGLFFLFLALKLAGVWALSWLWVFAPLWIPAAFSLLVGIGAVAFGWSVGSSLRKNRSRWEL